MARVVRVAVEGIERGARELTGPAAHYLTVVHRLEPGAGFVAFDPEPGLEADARVVRVERRSLICEFEEPRAALRRGALDVTLLQGVGKGDKLEDVVRTATALGARAVCFVAAERSVARPQAERATRLKSVAIEAARQSGRGDIPRIALPEPLEQVLEAWRTDGANKLCLEPGAGKPLGTRLAEPAALLIGPEGGLSPRELELADAAGFERVSLGPLTLRTELAAAVALGCFAAQLPGT